MDALSGAPPPFAFLAHDLVRKPVTTFRDHAWKGISFFAWQSSDAGTHRASQMRGVG
jgi:hypothetical protein